MAGVQIAAVKKELEKPPRAARPGLHEVSPGNKGGGDIQAGIAGLEAVDRLFPIWNIGREGH